MRAPDTRALQRRCCLSSVERVGGADMMFYNRPAILPMLKSNVPSLFGLDGNGKQLIIAESDDLNFRYLDIRKEGDTFNNYVSL
jgi:hypothetical protein